MLDDDSPGFGVDFVIDTGASFGELTQLAAAMESTEAKVLVEAKRIEQATAGMVSLGGATAEVKSFGVAATRELAAAAREMRAVEKSGEAMVRQLERQGTTFGKTREELRSLRAEEKALAAERVGNTDLATRIRAAEQAIYDQEFAAQRRAAQAAEAAAIDKAEAAAIAVAAAERDAQAIRSASLAYNQFEAAARRGMVALREQEAAEAALAKSSEAARLRDQAASADLAARSHAQLAAQLLASHTAMEADAVAAERMRASTDPLYAATSRLNAEIAESTRLYHAGATAPAEYARQQDVLTGRLRTLTAEQEAMHASARRGSGTMTQLSFQINDVATMAAMGAPPFQIFASQIGQIVQVAQQAEGGMKGFGREVGGMALRFAPLLAVTALAGVAISRWMDDVGKSAGLKSYVSTLGLTAKETEKLKDVTVTTGDFVAGAWKTLNDGLGLTAGGKKLVDYLFGPNDAQQVAGFVAEIYGFFVGGYKGIVEVWGLLPAVIGDVVSRSAKATVVTIEAMINGAIDRVNALAKGANGLIGTDLFGTIDQVKIATPGIDAAVAAYAGAGTKAGAAFGNNVAAETKKALGWMKGVAAEVGANSVAAAQARLRKQRDELVKDRPDKKDKPDRHAEQLARDAAAIEAQIRNLYALADAYGVSGAAALIAEARVKAESQAIKQRGDIEAAVDRQVRLAIAQRVSDAAKSASVMRDEAAIQAQVNGMVAAGLVPAERANELVRDRIADLPLLHAIEAAQQRGLKVETDKATAALKAQTDARAARDAASAGAFFTGAHHQAERQLEAQREELRLVGATDMERVRAMATLQATQKMQADGRDLASIYAKGYIADEVAIAVGAEKVRQAQDEWNASIGRTAELFDEIDRSVQSAASGMADAFGEVGRSIGDVASIMSGYYADQANLQQQHEAAIRKAGANEAAITHENRLFAIRSASMQVGAYGDMVGAAKGFFKEGSAGYKAMAAAEKVYRVAQLAMSVAAMVQNITETTTSVANAAARATADGTAGIAAQAKLPFPANIAAMAATGAALVAAGITVFGGKGGGGSAAPVTNTGTGTVLGDPAAQSESLKRSIDQLREVDTTTSVFARQMAGSLRSIDDQIGGFAAVLVRAGNVDASTGVTEGFKKDAIGSVLSKIPLVGGILGGLFGSKTTVIGSGLFGGAQSIGDILAGGFDASTYSDVQKKKKLFGITTSTKTSTQFAAADAGLENQFTLILRSFAGAIASAAGPLEQATGDVQARLNGFVVDIGKIDLKGLTGSEIQEKLEAVFGAAADGMAEAAFPGLTRFQKAGEGAFETLTRVASTLEAVSTSLDLLGTSSRAMSIDAKLGLADQFDSVGDLTNAVEAYLGTYYTAAEQSAAKTAQLTRVFDSLGLAVPATLAGFRGLVEAQDLTTAAGQATYATLLQLAPAFADLQEALGATKSAADIAAERQDLERKLLELRGDTAAIRAADLAKLDASNRALQEQIYAIQDAQEAAKAADELAKAWTTIGDSIMDEVNRIRGLADAGGGDTFASLLGRFNAANDAARGGDMDAAKGLPALSQALLSAAADAATSRQELARVQAATAAQLEATYGVVGALTAAKPTSTAAQVTAAAESQGATAPAAANDDTAGELRALREEVAGMRRDNNSANATIAGSAARAANVLENVTSDNGGQAISVAAA